MNAGSENANDFQIEEHPPDAPRRSEALQLLSPDDPDSTGPSRRGHRALTDSARRQGLEVALVLSAGVDGRMVAAAAAVASPGRNALVVLGPSDGASIPFAQGVALLREIRGRLFEQGIVIVQGLLPPDLSHVARMYRDAGFRFLAELRYLERDVAVDAPPQPAHDPGLSYIDYSPDLETRFVDTLNRTYVDSLDCPGLAGLRDTRDVLVGHRHSGVFDPSAWFLASVDQEAVGILLLGDVPERSCVEIVYMGVLPAWRGRGVSHGLLSLAVDTARRRRKKSLTLAVDTTNHFAERMYEAWGFAEIGRRRAWIALRPR